MKTTDLKQTDGGTAQAAPPSAAPPAQASFITKLFSSAIVRFAGWWSIFAGVLALNSVCPVCGGSACPVGIGTTGVIAGVIAAVKLWGGKCVTIVSGYLRRPYSDDAETA